MASWWCSRGGGGDARSELAAMWAVALGGARRERDERGQRPGDDELVAGEGGAAWHAGGGDSRWVAEEGGQPKE